MGRLYVQRSVPGRCIRCFPDESPYSGSVTQMAEARPLVKYILMGLTVCSSSFGAVDDLTARL